MLLKLAITFESIWSGGAVGGAFAWCHAITYKNYRLQCCTLVSDAGQRPDVQVFRSAGRRCGARNKLGTE